MATATSLLVALAQLSLVLSLPAGGQKRDSSHLNERAVQIASDLQPTISYSTAIESLQSASITILPSITGVRIAYLPLLHWVINRSLLTRVIRVSQQSFLLAVGLLRIP